MTKAATKARLATYVPVAPMRERFLALRKRDGMTPADLAWRVGWTFDNGTRPDTRRTLRTIGLISEPSSRRPLEDKTVTYENAVKLCRALDMDPIDAGV